MGLYDDLKKSDSLDPVEVLGSSNLTMANKTSGVRLQLTSAYNEQALILNEAEVPKLYTGYEKELGSYNDSLKVAKTNYKILHKIEKYPSYPNTHYTLIVQDINTGVVSIIENKHYEKLAEDHGYFKPNVKTDYLNMGNIIEKGAVISKSNSHDEYLNYRYGVNANVAYISKKDNIEDGIIISESFANRVSYASIETIEITLGFNDILLNIYGDSVIYRSFPDMFNEVNDGIFCAKRSIDHMNCGCNTTVNSLMNIDTNDELFYANGKLIDVEIFINSNAELVRDNGHRQQIIMYYNIIKDYKYKVMKHLEQYVKNPMINLTVEANTRYYNYKNYIDASMSPNNDIKFVNSTGIFEFAYLKFTIGRNVNLVEGSKLTNRSGGKGVICKIIPDDLMPEDEYGTKAEVILNPCGIVGRSNPSQLYEQELNFISSRIVDKIKNEKSLSKKYDILYKFFSIIDKEMCDKFNIYYKNMTPLMKQQYMNNIVEKGIYIRQHPFNNISFEELKYLYRTFNIKPSKLKINVLDPNDGKIKSFKSINSVIIGQEYIMVLKHTPDSKLSSVSISDVNNLGLPHKSSAKAKNSPFKNTPITLGEMELNVAINRVDPLIVNRLMSGNGGNLKHRDNVAKMLLEEDPLMYHDINIKNEDIIDSIASDAFTAIFYQLGYTIYSDTFKTTVEIGVKNEDE